MSETTRVFVSLAKRISFILECVLYEIYYFFLGGQSMIEDFLYKSKNKCDIVKKYGETAIVTGGARGIGAALVKKLLQCEMTVIIGCRSVESGVDTVQRIRNEGITGGEVHIYKLDLLSLKSVEEFSNQVKQKFSYLNLIINNAGIMFPPYQETEDGFESQLAVNYLAPFYLCHLLLPLLNKKEASRIVNVTSCAHAAAKPIYFDDLNMKNSFITGAAYAQSKLCQILFTMELERRLRERNSNVYILAVHPGIVNTDLFNGTPLKTLFPWVLKFFSKDVDAGASSILAPSISNNFLKKGGIYLSNCCISTPSKQAKNVQLQKELFEHSLRLLNLSNFGEP